MASDPPRYFTRSNNPHGSQGTNYRPSDNTIDDVFSRVLNLPCTTSPPRVGSNGRNRVSPNSRSRLERIQTRRSDPIRDYNQEIDNRQQDNKENETAPPKPPKPRNCPRNIQENRGDNGNVNNSAKREGGCSHPNSMSYTLPRAELSLSPPRLPTPASQNMNNLPLSLFPHANPLGAASLRKDQSSSSHGHFNNVPSTSKATELSGVASRSTGSYETWINAPEFRPKKIHKIPPAHMLTGLEFDQNLCFNLRESGVCKMQTHCPYAHDGDLCDVCNRRVLHPTDEEQRQRHHQSCHHTRSRREQTTAQIAKSRDKTCGICLETVIEKPTYDRRFGILNRCNHVFCLSCIRQWRQARDFENKVVKSCPSCRVPSEFVCPSTYWVDTEDEKEKMIKSYKQVLANKPCKYFKQGRGECPFGNKCFYLHALPDGTKTDVGPPRRRHRPTPEERLIGIEINILQQLMTWDSPDFDAHLFYSLTEEFDEITGFFSDSDDSDGFDFEIVFPRTE